MATTLKHQLNIWMGEAFAVGPQGKWEQAGYTNVDQ